MGTCVRSARAVPGRACPPLSRLKAGLFSLKPVHPRSSHHFSTHNAPLTQVSCPLPFPFCCTHPLTSRYTGNGTKDDPVDLTKPVGNTAEKYLRKFNRPNPIQPRKWQLIDSSKMKAKILDEDEAVRIACEYFGGPYVTK